MTAGHTDPGRSDAALSLRGVRKAYGAVEAVRGLDLDVAPGEVVTVVGPSGCGKSTLLRLVAGLEHTDAGVVSVGGEVVDDGHRHRPPERRRVGMVFQDHALFPHLDVARNVAFGLDGLPRAARAARVAEALELVGLPHLGARLPHELSGGEQQRVALARALAPRPSVVLLDEPFSSLDENLRARVRAETLAALRHSGSAALLVTHDQTEALALGDRVAVVHAGRALQVGEPEEVYERPVSRFVATFLGEATFVPATVVDGRVRCELGPLPLDPPAGAGAGLEVMLRPHELRLAAGSVPLGVGGSGGGPGTGPGTGTGAPGHVTSVEYVGPRTTHEVVLGSGRAVSVWTSGRERHPVGAAVTVTLAPDAAPALLDGETVLAGAIARR